MKKIINHLRRQPEETRRHILHITTIVGAVVLVALWVYSLSTNLSNPDTKAKVSNDLKSLTVLKDNIVNGNNNTAQ